MTASSSPVVAAMARKRGSDYRWTKAEERTLRSMREAKATWEEIAAAIPGRTERAIRHRALALGIRIPRPPAPVVAVVEPEPIPEAIPAPEYLVIVRTGYGDERLSVARGVAPEIDRIGREWMRSHPGQVTIEEVTV